MLTKINKKLNSLTQWCPPFWPCGRDEWHRIGPKCCPDPLHLDLGTCWRNTVCKVMLSGPRGFPHIQQFGVAIYTATTSLLSNFQTLGKLHGPDNMTPQAEGCTELAKIPFPSKPLSFQWVYIFRNIPKILPSCNVARLITASPAKKERVISSFLSPFFYLMWKHFSFSPPWQEHSHIHSPTAKQGIFLPCKPWSMGFWCLLH